MEAFKSTTLSLLRCPNLLEDQENNCRNTVMNLARMIVTAMIRPCLRSSQAPPIPLSNLNRPSLAQALNNTLDLTFWKAMM